MKNVLMFIRTKIVQYIILTDVLGENVLFFNKPDPEMLKKIYSSKNKTPYCRVKREKDGEEGGMGSNLTIRKQ